MLEKLRKAGKVGNLESSNKMMLRIIFIFIQQTPQFLWLDWLIISWHTWHLSNSDFKIISQSYHPKKVIVKTFLKHLLLDLIWVISTDYLGLCSRGFIRDLQILTWSILANSFSHSRVKPPLVIWVFSFIVLNNWSR